MRETTSENGASSRSSMGRRRLGRRQRLRVPAVGVRDMKPAIDLPRCTGASPNDSPRGIRIEAIFQSNLFEERKKTDRLFLYLLLAQWALGLAVALVFSPYAWAGKSRTMHFHVEVAILLGAVVNALPIALILLRPGDALTRHVVAIAQMLWSALLIHLTGGRIETHFHIFGSLAFLAFYRDWRILLTATLVVAGGSSAPGPDLAGVGVRHRQSGMVAISRARLVGRVREHRAGLRLPARRPRNARDGGTRSLARERQRDHRVGGPREDRGAQDQRGTLQEAGREHQRRAVGNGRRTRPSLLHLAAGDAAVRHRRRRALWPMPRCSTSCTSTIAHGAKALANLAASTTPTISISTTGSCP